MKHHKLIALVLAATLLLTACAASEPELVRYDHPTGLSLTMWEGFEVQDAEGFVGGYINQDQGIAILMAEELFASLSNVGIDPEMTLEEYGRFLMDCYGLEGTVESDALGNTRFVYDRDVQGGQARYFAYLYRNDVAFWTVTFMSARDKADGLEETFSQWAATIELPTEAVGQVRGNS